MKGEDNISFWILLLTSTIVGYWIFDETFNRYSDMITFLSIMIGFKITSLSILFDSPLKKTLYDRKIEKYGTELHRLKNFYKHSLIFEVVSVILLFVIPENIVTIEIYAYKITIGRYLIVLPILLGVVFCFYKVYYDLLHIFTHPTNN
ncbi:hypothetical protein QUF50_02335 [Thiotrichales bacterium HSG1]|nr:hypothetical protein [Thiotrichales bacterium HSG1]